MLPAVVPLVVARELRLATRVGAHAASVVLPVRPRERPDRRAPEPLLCHVAHILSEDRRADAGDVRSPLHVLRTDHGIGSFRRANIGAAQVRAQDLTQGEAGAWLRRRRTGAPLLQERPHAFALVRRAEQAAGTAAAPVHALGPPGAERRPDRRLRGGQRGAGAPRERRRRRPPAGRGPPRRAARVRRARARAPPRPPRAGRCRPGRAPARAHQVGEPLGATGPRDHAEPDLGLADRARRRPGTAGRAPSASSSPPPSANPLTAAIETFGMASSRSHASPSASTRRPDLLGPHSAIALMSAPAAKIFGRPRRRSPPRRRARPPRGSPLQLHPHLQIDRVGRRTVEADRRRRRRPPRAARLPHRGASYPSPASASLRLGRRGVRRRADAVDQRAFAGRRRPRPHRASRRAPAAASSLVTASADRPPTPPTVAPVPASPCRCRGATAVAGEHADQLVGATTSGPSSAQVPASSRRGRRPRRAPPRRRHGDRGERPVPRPRHERGRRSAPPTAAVNHSEPAPTTWRARIDRVLQPAVRDGLLGQTLRAAGTVGRIGGGPRDREKTNRARPPPAPPPAPSGSDAVVRRQQRVVVGLIGPADQVDDRETRSRSISASASASSRLPDGDLRAQRAQRLRRRRPRTPARTSSLRTSSGTSAWPTTPDAPVTITVMAADATAPVPRARLRPRGAPSEADAERAARALRRTRRVARDDPAGTDHRLALAGDAARWFHPLREVRAQRRHRVVDPRRAPLLRAARRAALPARVARMARRRRTSGARARRSLRRHLAAAVDARTHRRRAAVPGGGRRQRRRRPTCPTPATASSPSRAGSRSRPTPSRSSGSASAHGRGWSGTADSCGTRRRSRRSTATPCCTSMCGATTSACATDGPC